MLNLNVCKVVGSSHTGRAAKANYLPGSLREIQADRASLRRRLNKRRKIDHDASEESLAGFHKFHYGYFGQVEEGALKMEIVSCDGGEFSRDPPRFTVERYRPENVLQDDGRVYCTKSSSCNLLLRHMGEVSFSVKSIVVRAPKDGYTAPIQQGLVFVGNNAKELLAGTSAYSIRYGELGNMTPSQRSSTPWDNQRLTLLESLNDVEIWEQSMLRRANTSQNSDSNEASRELATYFEYEELDDDTSRATHSNYLENCDEVATAPTPPPYGAPASSGEDDAYEHIETHQDLLHELSAGNEIDEDRIDRILRRLGNDYYTGRDRRPDPRRRATPGRFVEMRANSAAPEESQRIKPLRTFFIRPSRNEARIVFDPPM